MGKFALECPKCGSLNTASTFIFAKKTIQCGTCNEELNVKQLRLTSKVCPECGKIIVCDQAKLKGKKCPSCGAEFGIASATASYRMVNVTCPQCYCEIEIDGAKDKESCPICDQKIKVKEILAKRNQVKIGEVSVIKYEGDNETFVWKHPIEDFNVGSQLIVHESQEAVLFLNGKMMDSFSAGRYAMDTENMPWLQSAYELPTGIQNPFHAEIYFVNLIIQMGIKWGTDSRVRFIEPNTGIPLDIGASGALNLQVSDPRKLLIKLIGTTKGVTQNEILGDRNDYDRTKSIKGIFKPLILTSIKTNLAAVIKNQKINILEIDEHYEEISLALRGKVSAGFEEYGLMVPQLFVTNVSLPENDENFKRLKELSAAVFLGVRESEIKANVLAAERKAELEAETTLTEKTRMEAEREIIRAQADAARRRLEGLAEADVMAAMGYTQKDILQAEVQKAYAYGIGNMGGAGNSGGGIVSDLLGIKVGMCALEGLRDPLNEIRNGMKGLDDVSEDNTQMNKEMKKITWKCVCGSENVKRFCSECGKEKPNMWDCSCGARNNTGKFCPDCGRRVVSSKL